MAFVPSQNLLCDLLKAFGLEGRKGVRGLVLEVRVNEAARLHIEECIDTDQTPIDDIVGCLHRLTVERAEVDGRGCVTPVLHKPTKWEQSIPVGVDGMDLDAQREAFKGHLEGVCSVTPVLHKSKMLTPKEQESLRAACQGTVEPHWVPRKEISHSYTSFSPIERIVMEDGGIEVVDSTRRNPPTPEELEGRPIEQFREWRQAIREWGFVEHVAGPDGNPVDVSTDDYRPSVSWQLNMHGPGKPISGVMLPAGADIDTAKAILDATEPDEPTVIDNSK